MYDVVDGSALRRRAQRLTESGNGASLVRAMEIR